MYFIQYVGRKARKFDNVAGTGLSWLPEQIHPIHDNEKAQLLLAHPDIWRLVDESMAVAAHVPTPVDAAAKQDNTVAGLPVLPKAAALAHEQLQAQEVGEQAGVEEIPQAIPNHVADKVPPVVAPNVVSMKKGGRPTRQLPN